MIRVVDNYEDLLLGVTLYVAASHPDGSVTLAGRGEDGTEYNLVVKEQYMGLGTRWVKNSAGNPKFITLDDAVKAEVAKVQAKPREVKVLSLREAMGFGRG